MYWGPYVSVAEKKRRAHATLARLQKKNPELSPARLSGSAMADTWWGKAWNANLEKYADYRNRIGRGRSYLRHDCVLDLKISSGRVESLVMGSASEPYSVRIEIRRLNKGKWSSICDKAKDEIGSLQDLAAGRFPKALGDLFTAKGEGLFPSPREIKFDCSCYDWADMCKHVAAALYGVGARLDGSPELFFTLRGVQAGDLVSLAVEKRKKELLRSASKGRKSSRIMDGGDAKLSALFGVQFAGVKPKRKSPAGKKAAKKTRKKAGRARS